MIPPHIAAMMNGDDDERSVAADWLEENGMIDRARFVRIKSIGQLWLDKTAVFQKLEHVSTNTENQRTLVRLTGVLDLPQIASLQVAWSRARIVLLATADVRAFGDSPPRADDLRVELGRVSVERIDSGKRSGLFSMPNYGMLLVAGIRIR